MTEDFRPLILKPIFNDAMIAEMSLYDRFRRAEEMLAQRHPGDAIKMLKGVVEQEPNNAAAWELLGRAYFAAALLRPAEDAFRRLIELEPTSGWAHVALGLALDRQSRHREGAVYHRMASALTPDQDRRPRLVPADEPR
ncbi:tetratricopeptide repeat protein [Mumia zhuanghuii]|uniref:Tetratricopeptide repeat protein n=2 Tax=Mumia TaxID=1546255 RepID=A0ABW1QIN6_9ACTN|nr:MULTISPECIES: tetratricopeptide repeat protein [Mumia]KAA1425390.1 tetratricopeptide repeat protein [Mumia zhuanghuii]